jgi:hypothetical protein
MKGIAAVLISAPNVVKLQNFKPFSYHEYLSHVPTLTHPLHHPMKQKGHQNARVSLFV